MNMTDGKVYRYSYYNPNRSDHHPHHQDHDHSNDTSRTEYEHEPRIARAPQTKATEHASGASLDTWRMRAAFHARHAQREHGKRLRAWVTISRIHPPTSARSAAPGGSTLGPRLVQIWNIGLTRTSLPQLWVEIAPTSTESGRHRFETVEIGPQFGQLWANAGNLLA